MFSLIQIISVLLFFTQHMANTKYELQLTTLISSGSITAYPKVATRIDDFTKWYDLPNPNE